MENKRKIIYLAGFLFSVPMALTYYINSSFLASLVGEKLVGIVYVLGSISSILALLITPTIFRKIGGYKFLLLILLLDALSLLTLSFAKNAWSAVIIFIIYTSLSGLVIFSLDELLKIFSRDSATGKIRGIYLAICHLALIIAQLALATILGKFSFGAIYFISSMIMILFLLVSFFNLKNIPDPEYDKMKVLKYVKEFFKKRNLLRVYGLSLLVQLFYCWMIIYTPIYLFLHLGFAWREIGIIFAIMLLPFIILPVHLGKYGDKIGERKMLMFGFLVAGLATLSLFFIQEHKIWIWAMLLFITRVGAATIEVMSDAYFFKHIKAENEEFVGIYRSATPIAYIVGPIIASIIFIFVPAFNFIYIILGAIMLYGIYLSSMIKKSDT